MLTFKEGPVTLAFHRPQPIPIQTLSVQRGGVTAILRRWMPGDTIACRLCPLGTCSATNDACLVAVDGFVDAENAPFYRIKPSASRALKLEIRPHD
jgi:hypothetical protein